MMMISNTGLYDASIDDLLKPPRLTRQHGSDLSDMVRRNDPDYINEPSMAPVIADHMPHHTRSGRIYRSPGLATAAMMGRRDAFAYKGFHITFGIHVRTETLRLLLISPQPLSANGVPYAWVLEPSSFGDDVDAGDAGTIRSWFAFDHDSNTVLLDREEWVYPSLSWLPIWYYRDRMAFVEIPASMRLWFERSVIGGGLPPNADLDFSVVCRLYNDGKGVF